MEGGRGGRGEGEERGGGGEGVDGGGKGRGRRGKGELEEQFDKALRDTHQLRYIIAFPMVCTEFLRSTSPSLLPFPLH